MKKIIATIALTLLSASAAFAASNITATKHNLSATTGTGTIKATVEGQLCVFCHTPHSAVVPVPLWNRNNPTAAANYRLYSSSQTLTSAARGAVLSADSISLQCLSCHDGTVAEIGSRVASGSIAMNGAAWTNGNIGSNLTDDHPIGFSYTAAQPLDAGLKASPVGVQFFGPTSKMECASCHLVHDNSAPPFLRMSNAGSALCIACHAK